MDTTRRTTAMTTTRSLIEDDPKFVATLSTTIVMVPSMNIRVWRMLMEMAIMSFDVNCSFPPKKCSVKILSTCLHHPRWIATTNEAMSFPVPRKFVATVLTMIAMALIRLVNPHRNLRRDPVFPPAPPKVC